MRRLMPLRSLFACAVVLVSARALAADDDLPTGNDPPRIVPIANADVYWAYHDTPPAGGDATFTTSAERHDEFQVGLVSLGARLEHAKLMGQLILQAGTAADALYVSYPINATWKHVQEANVGWRFSQDVSVTAGLFSSPFGNESFPTAGNWNYVHSFISDASPYYVAGVKLKWDVAPTVALTGIVFNGWQTLQDANKSKSGALRVDWTPNDSIQIFDAISAGPETPDNSHVRYFDDLVVKINPHPRVGIAAEGYGAIDHGGDAPDDKFWAAALWLRWFFSETTYVALRGERLVDTGGLIAGCGANGQTCGEGKASQGAKLWGGTITVGWQPHPMFLVRVEGTHRRSDIPYFAAATDANTGGVVGARDQTTIFAASATFSY